MSDRKALGPSALLWSSLRALFALARAVQRVDRGFVLTPGRSVLVVGRAFAQAIARAHRGNVQDMTLLYLAGLGLLLLARLFAGT